MSDKRVPTTAALLEIFGYKKNGPPENCSLENCQIGKVGCVKLIKMFSINYTCSDEDFKHKTHNCFSVNETIKFKNNAFFLNKKEW